MYQFWAWWKVAANFIPRPRIAAASSPVTSRFGPIRAEFQELMVESHMENPSWCSATGPAKRAPEAANSSAHSSASNFSAVNRSISSL